MVFFYLLPNLLFVFLSFPIDIICAFINEAHKIISDITVCINVKHIVFEIKCAHHRARVSKQILTTGPVGNTIKTFLLSAHYVPVDGYSLCLTATLGLW